MPIWRSCKHRGESMKELSTPRVRLMNDPPAGLRIAPLDLLGNKAASSVPLRRNPTAQSQEAGTVPSSGRLGSVDLSLIPPLEACSPGFAPTEYNVLIAPPDKAEASHGGIIFSDETKDADFISAQVGRLIAASPIAFN